MPRRRKLEELSLEGWPPTSPAEGGTGKAYARAGSVRGMKEGDVAATTYDYTAYNPVKQQDYVYHPNIEPSDQVAYYDANKTDLRTRAQYVDWVTGKYGTYEAYLNTLTAKDRRSHYSYGPSKKRPWWGGDEEAYHRIVRANQRRLDGQPPVDESGSSLAGMSSSSGAGASGAGGTALAGAGNWMKQNKGAVIGGVAALALVIILARKR